VAITATVLDAGNVAPITLIVTTRLSADRLIETLPTIFVPFTSNPTVFVLIVFGFNDFENVSTTVAFNPIPVAPLFGVTATTCGPVVSATAAVVNVLKKPLPLFPAKSDGPGFTATCIVAPPGSGVVGVNVTTAPFTA